MSASRCTPSCTRAALIYQHATSQRDREIAVNLYGEPHPCIVGRRVVEIAQRFEFAPQVERLALDLRLRVFGSGEK